MVKRNRFMFGSVLVAISSVLFFCTAKEALSSQEPGTMRSKKYVASGKPMLRMTAKGSGRSILSSLAVTREDLRQISDTDLISVASPADATPEEIVRTIVEDTSLPSHIREPFIKLAKAKAPHLLQEDGRGSLKVEVARLDRP